ncbi:MAG: hypothetical protein PHV02_03740, partial [Rhodocyclaceae bacterium]|nr:hypothetical protein [Rhodocyclaceae bacterium]
TMKPLPISQAKNPALRGSLQALQRAALRAREIAAATGTLIVVSRDGVIQHLEPTKHTLVPTSFCTGETKTDIDENFIREDVVWALKNNK